MNKNIKTVALILACLFLIGCGRGNISSGESNSLNSLQLNSTPAAETWWEAYSVFLEDYPVSNENEYYLFALRDMSNDTVPELIIVQKIYSTLSTIVTLYSYDSNVYKIGESDNPESYASSLRISDNPIFPGLFTCSWGGGVEHYGYLLIGKGHLVYEHLWDMDRTGDTPQEIDFSDEKELINESIKVYTDIYTEADTTDNLLDMEIINDENIDEVLLGW